MWERAVTILKQINLVRFGHTQVSVGKNVYVFGGREGISTEEKLLNDLWAFDTDSKTWTEVEVRSKIRRFFENLTVN